MPVPSVGRDVHYFAKTGEAWAAKITAVRGDGRVSLIVFPPSAAPLPIDNVRFCAGEQRYGCCAWPARVGTD